MRDDLVSTADIADVIRYRAKLLISAPAVAALAFLAIASALPAPKHYLSTAVLRLDAEDARITRSVMHAPELIDLVLATIEVPGITIEARRRFIDDAHNMYEARPGLYRLEVIDQDPQRAESIAAALVYTWARVTAHSPDVIVTAPSHPAKDRQPNKWAVAALTALVAELILANWLLLAFRSRPS